MPSMETTLVENFSAVDSNAFEYNGTWWLLCGLRETCLKWRYTLGTQPFRGPPWTPRGGSLAQPGWSASDETRNC